MTDGPQDPISTMMEGAIAAHEMFLSYQAAGFTENQALELVKAAVMAAVGGLG